MRFFIPPSLPLPICHALATDNQCARCVFVIVARRKFSSRLSEILLPYTPNALLVAQEVEVELFEVHGQRYAVLWLLHLDPILLEGILHLG